MKKGALLVAGLALVLAACRGSAPKRDGSPELGISAVILGLNVHLPTGETPNARMALNLEGEGEEGREGETYRLSLRAQESRLYQVEPGDYRFAPGRGFFGGLQTDLFVRVEGRTYRVPFPRDILRRPLLRIKPGKIAAVGIIECRLVSATPGRPAVMRVTLDDSLATRRKALQEVIGRMMDPEAPAELRRSAVAWTRALDQGLIDMLSEHPKAPLYKPASP